MAVNARAQAIPRNEKKLAVTGSFPRPSDVTFSFMANDTTAASCEISE
jgi:hypothetical protein